MQISTLAVPTFPKNTHCFSLPCLTRKSLQFLSSGALTKRNHQIPTPNLPPLLSPLVTTHALLINSTPNSQEALLALPLQSRTPNPTNIFQRPWQVPLSLDTA